MRERWNTAEALQGEEQTSVYLASEQRSSVARGERDSSCSPTKQKWRLFKLLDAFKIFTHPAVLRVFSSPSVSGPSLAPVFGGIAVVGGGSFSAEDQSEGPDAEVLLKTRSAAE
ncbi:hypothetical protein UY3_10417 [Chelonia mydas]|uniref:Uncharacterized protein n=1 Tax=Chelonia mydas TaxID=8469 RepID=M7BKA4_CHEMY|nr:hypothetical protein UY3_10417 [Chelonia mydas]